MSDTSEILLEHLRQYLHNDNSGLTMAYDKTGVERLVADYESQLERLRMQLAACGVVAMANTRETAAKQRDMHSDYISASCQDVIAVVDREMALREERDQLKAQINGMKQAIDELIEHSFGVAGLHLNGEVAKWSDLRGDGRFCEWLAVFDDTPEQCLAAHDAEVIE